MTRSRASANQSAAAAACKEYAEAQEIYHRTDYNRDGVLEYAQSFSGNNSLLENTAGAGDLQLIDHTFAMAEGLPGKVPPKAGYVFKILKAQGPSARGGAKNYLAPSPDGKSTNMTGGYALIAAPAIYDTTGCGCFSMNRDGTIYEADLGVDTPKLFAKMSEFNPDPKEGWFPTE